MMFPYIASLLRFPLRDTNLCSLPIERYDLKIPLEVRHLTDVHLSYEIMLVKTLIYQKTDLSPLGVSNC